MDCCQIIFSIAVCLNNTSCSCQVAVLPMRIELITLASEIPLDKPAPTPKMAQHNFKPIFPSMSFNKMKEPDLEWVVHDQERCTHSFLS